MYGVACRRTRFSRSVIATLIAAVAFSVFGAIAKTEPSSAAPSGCAVEPGSVVTGGLAIYASITNHSDSALTFKEAYGLEGEFAVLPQCKIGINETATIVSIPEFLSGTEFSVVYELDNHSTARFTYENPLFGEGKHAEYLPPGYALHTHFTPGEADVFDGTFTKGCECDGIPDEWKEKGVTIDPKTNKPVPSGTPGGEFIDLPHMGVSLDRPTVLVQMDWMENEQHNQKLRQAAIDKVIEAFNNDPVTYPGLIGSGNGATRPGITLIVDNGPNSTITPGGAKWGSLSKASAVPWEEFFLTGTRKAGYNPANFTKLVDSNFTPTGRVPMFHYAVAAAAIANDKSCTSGLAPEGSGGFIVSLGGPRKAGEPCWENEVGSQNEQTGTFMHELGHALGLYHGGEDGNAIALKPNYPSVMDYLYQFSGVLRNGEWVYDYSREPEPSLEEKTLTEEAGISLGANNERYGFSWICPNGKGKSSSTLVPVDWNCDGAIPDGGKGFDVTGEQTEEEEEKGERNKLQELKGTLKSDWERINFKTGGVGTGAAITVPSLIENVDEITPEIAARVRIRPQITYDGALTGHYHDPVAASATLVDPNTENSPVVGARLAFKLGASASDSCTATTDSSGRANCTITPTQPAGPYGIVASFAGDSTYQPASDTRTFAITPEETTMTYTGPTAILVGGTEAKLTAKMVEDGGGDSDADGGSPAPAPSEPVTLSLGTQACKGATDGAGNVACTIPSVTVPLGPETLGAAFAGDPYYSASTDSKTAIVFAFPSRGAFTLADRTVASAITPTTWWADNWSRLNSLSAGPASAAFEGFARIISLPTTTPAAKCGSSWTTSSGNSAPPPSSVPAYMGVVVTSAVTKSGSTISGNAVKIVVVKTNPGYTADPGHHGTGTIVATYC